MFAGKSFCNFISKDPCFIFCFIIGLLMMAAGLLLFFKARKFIDWLSKIKYSGIPGKYSEEQIQKFVSLYKIGGLIIFFWFLYIWIRLLYPIVNNFMIQK